MLKAESKQKSEVDKTVFGANKEKAGEAKKFEKVGNPEGKIQEKKKLPDKTVFSANKKKAGKAEEFEKVGYNDEGKSEMEKKTADETVFITNKEKAGKAKEFELESELKKGKKQDLDKLDHNAKAEIGEGDTKELKKVMELEEKKPLDKTIFSNNKKRRARPGSLRWSTTLRGRSRRRRRRRT